MAKRPASLALETIARVCSEESVDHNALLSTIGTLSTSPNLANVRLELRTPNSNTRIFPTVQADYVGGNKSFGISPQMPGAQNAINAVYCEVTEDTGVEFTDIIFAGTQEESYARAKIASLNVSCYLSKG